MKALAMTSYSKYEPSLLVELIIKLPRIMNHYANLRGQSTWKLGIIKNETGKEFA